MLKWKGFRKKQTQSTVTRYSLSHWDRYIMADISQTRCGFLDAFSWMEIYEFRLIFHTSLPKGSINNIPALVQIMAWRRPGDKPLSEPMMVSLLTHTCVTRLQWIIRYPKWIYIARLNWFRLGILFVCRDRNIHDSFFFIKILIRVNLFNSFCTFLFVVFRL